jgi:hypothetical protein
LHPQQFILSGPNYAAHTATYASMPIATMHGCARFVEEDVVRSARAISEAASVPLPVSIPPSAEGTMPHTMRQGVRMQRAADQANALDGSDTADGVAAPGPSLT